MNKITFLFSCTGNFRAVSIEEHFYSSITDRNEDKIKENKTQPTGKINDFVKKLDRI